jgi:hypothetical protein
MAGVESTVPDFRRVKGPRGSCKATAKVLHPDFPE